MTVWPHITAVVSVSAARCLILRRSDFGCCLVGHLGLPRTGECGSHFGRRTRDAKGHTASDDRLRVGVSHPRFTYAISLRLGPWTFGQSIGSSCKSLFP